MTKHIHTPFTCALRALARGLATEPEQPEAIRTSRRAPSLVVATVCVGAFMGQFDASVVSAALPRLATDLHASVAAVEWVALGYSLVLASSIITIGHVSDGVGHKLLYLWGFVIFTAGSALCGAAPTLVMLISARVLQAVGASMLQANSLALIRQAIPSQEVGKGTGWQSLAQALGLTLGPALGGALLSFMGWRWLFWVNVPAGAVGLGLGWFLLPASASHRRPARGDGAGACLLALATAFPLMYLSLANRYGYTNGALSAALAAGVGFAGWFVVHELRADEPLLDLAMFRSPALSVGLGSALISYAALFGTLSGVSYVPRQRACERLVGRAPAWCPGRGAGITAPMVGHSRA